MKNLRNFSQHIKEGYSLYPEQDYSALSENDFDPDAVESRPLEEEEEEELEDENGFVNYEEYESDEPVGNSPDYDTEFHKHEEGHDDEDDVVKYDDYANDYDPEFDEDEPISSRDNYHNIKRFASFERPEMEEYEEEFPAREEYVEDDVEDDEFDGEEVSSVVGEIHPEANANGLANLLDAHGAAIETGDRVNDLHHGGEYVVKELEPFKVIDLSSGRIFGAEHEPDRFEVLDKGHSLDAAHHKAHALHTLASQYCDDHELCQNELGFTPSSYDHVFHSKALHDKLVGK